MKQLKTPLKKEDLLGLSAGEFIYLSGTVVTARDKAYKRALKIKEFPVDLCDSVLFHAGPLVKKINEDWVIVSIGPTTSSRMNSMQRTFMELFRVSAVVGKGGMSPDIFKDRGVYLAMCGGTAALGARCVKQVKQVHWLDLGAAEAVWVLEVKMLGPLLVGVDCKGNSAIKY